MAHSSLFALAVMMFAIGMMSGAHAETATQYIDDAAITAKVKGAIIADSHLIAASPLQAMQVSVSTDHGNVFLSGNVDSQPQESEAVQIASQVNGVVKVTDNLSIARTQNP